MAGVRANIALNIDATLTGTNDIGDPKQRVVVEKALAFSAGTAAIDEANILFADERTVATTENLDFAGTLANAFGTTIAAAEILLIYIEADEANAGILTFGPAASNGFTGPFGDASDRLSVKPGEFSAHVSESGWAVTASTGDLLTVAGTNVTYKVVILGRTTAA